MDCFVCVYIFVKFSWGLQCIRDYVLCMRIIIDSARPVPAGSGRVFGE